MEPNFIITLPHQTVRSFVTEDITELTLDDMYRACAAPTDTIIELISEGVIDSVLPWGLHTAGYQRGL